MGRVLIATAACKIFAKSSPRGVTIRISAGLWLSCLLNRSRYFAAMTRPVVPVKVRAVLPTNAGRAVFVGNDDKTFVIYVDESVGAAIAMFMAHTPKERPLTHDLMGHLMTALGAKVERIIINELKNSTYFARLILKQQNELGTKLVEIDARPSDCLAIATAQKRPIFVTSSLFNQVEDMSKWLEEIKDNESADPE